MEVRSGSDDYGWSSLVALPTKPQEILRNQPEASNESCREGDGGGDGRGQKDRKNDGSISEMGGEGVALRDEIRFC